MERINKLEMNRKAKNLRRKIMYAKILFIAFIVCEDNSKLICYLRTKLAHLISVFVFINIGILLLRVEVEIKGR